MINTKFMINYSFYTKREESNEVAVFEYDRNKNYTYNDLEDRANRLANYLRYELKINKGDRVAICARNCIEQIDAFIATSKIGAILTTYNCLLKENELISLITNESPKVMFYDDSYKARIEKIKSITDGVSYIVIGDEYINYDMNYIEIMNYDNGYIQDEVFEDDIHMLIHTGGTTGIPKAAMISYKSIYHNMVTEVETMKLSNSDIVYTFLPLFHTAGWNVFTIPLLFIGGKVILTKDFYTKKALTIFEKLKPTVALGVSTIFRMFINDENFDNTDFSSLRLLYSGASATPKKILDKFLDKGIKIGSAYGMTECGPNNIVMPIEDMSIEEIKIKWNSVGKVMKLNEVRVIDENGNDVETNNQGELIWKSNLIFSGYWNNETESKNTLIDGWVYTGDIGTVDEDGFYYIVGRRKNMFITGGENIFPAEVEEALYNHSNIHEVCVIGVEDEKWGEVGKAIIVLKEMDNTTGEDIKKFLKDKISSIKIPKFYQIVHELPKNSVGKIEVGKIKQYYAESNKIEGGK